MQKGKRILCAVDFSATSQVALAYAANLAAQLQARVTVLHIYQPPNPVYPDQGPMDSLQLEQQVQAASQKQLLECIAQVGMPDVHMETEVRTGIAYEEISKAAEDVGAQLIVIGTHGRTGLPRAFLGSVAERVVRVATVPVLTIRDPAKA